MPWPEFEMEPIEAGATFYQANARTPSSIEVRIGSPGGLKIAKPTLFSARQTLRVVERTDFLRLHLDLCERIP
jgi:hypothetical protein